MFDHESEFRVRLSRTKNADIHEMTLVRRLVFLVLSCVACAPTWAAEQGAKLYAHYCAACHGIHGTGGVGVPLALPDFLAAADDDFLRRTISVRQQLQGETNATTELVAPKFGSERVVYAPAELIALLAEHVRRTGVRPGQ